MAGPAGFIGRESELSRLLGALGGDARLVLVSGDAGVGKTRLIGEGMARAAAAGVGGEVAGLEGGGLMEAALSTAPEFVRDEVGRLVPQLGPGGEPGLDEP